MDIDEDDKSLRRPSDEEMALLELLPGNYVASTTPAEREQHDALHRRLKGGETVQLAWEPIGSAHDKGGGGHIALYLVFPDAVNSLSIITSTLGSLGVNILRVAAFSTTTGIAIDTLELSAFEEAHAEQLKARLADAALATTPSVGASLDAFDGGGSEGGGVAAHAHTHRHSAVRFQV